MNRGITAYGLEPVDLITSIEAAEGAGYDAIELRTYHVEDYLNEGHTVQDLVEKLAGYEIRPSLIAPILNLEMDDGPERDTMIQDLRRTCEILHEIHCPGIQVCSGNRLADMDWPAARKETAGRLGQLADVAAEYRVKLVYEPLAWMPACNTTRVLEVIDEAGRDNLKALVDTFQAYAGGDDLDTLRKTDPALIGSVHLGDTNPKKADVWHDEDRAAMPGEGIVPIQRIMDAILSTGYDGVITDEVYGPEVYGSWTRLKLAKTLKTKADAILASL